MPTIVNAYAGNESIAENLRKIADNMFGNQAHQEVLRQQAEKYRRENEAAESLPNLYRGGDPLAIGGAILRANPGATNVGNVGLARTAATPGIAPDDPRLATAALGAGHSYEGTAAGLGATLGSHERIAQMQTERAAATQRAIADRQIEAEAAKNRNTPVTVYDKGRPTIMRQSDVYGHEGAPLHKDQVIGGVIQRSLDQPTDFDNRFGAAYGTPPTNQPTAPPGAGGPFGGLPNDVRHLAGLPSYSAEQEQNNARDELARTGIPDLPPRPLPNDMQSVQDASSGGGLGAAVTNIPAHTWNWIFGSDLAPELHASLNNLSNLAARTRALPISGVSRDSVQREKWNNENIPQPGGMLGIVGAGGEQAQAKVMALTSRLRQQYATDATLARDPATPPAERAKLVAQLTELRSVIEGWEAPTAKHGQQPTTSTAPQQGTVHQVPSVGKMDQPHEGQPSNSVIRYDAQGNRVQ